METQPAESSVKTNETTKPPLTYSEKQWLNVKKMSPKNRKRLRNERLRKMLIPKNSVMVLNELLREDGDATACFHVEPTIHSTYCANLAVKGFIVKGYGDSKNEAKKSAAEKALRAIYLERLMKLNKMEAEWLVKREKRQKEREQLQKEMEQRQNEGLPLDTEDNVMESADAQPGGASESNAREEREDRVTLPMVQLASLALYKLYSSWERDGCVVPNFRSAENKSQNLQNAKKEKAKAKKPPKRRQLPLNAVTLHPGFLLYYMIPTIEYKDMAIEGPKTQQVFVVSVEAEGKVYIGRAHSKKEARRLAAAAACNDLFQVTFENKSSSNQPMWADDVATPTKKAKGPEPME